MNRSERSAAGRRWRQLQCHTLGDEPAGGRHHRGRRRDPGAVAADQPGAGGAGTARRRRGMVPWDRASGPSQCGVRPTGGGHRRGGRDGGRPM